MESSLLLAIEISSVICSLFFIWGISKRNAWAWPFGIVASAQAAFLFYHQNLFSESYLNVIYVVLGFYGWKIWKKQAQANASDKIAVLREWKLWKHLVCLALGGGAIYLTGSFFAIYTQADLPFLDAFTSVFGVLATVLEANKMRSSWYYWIVLNSLSLALYLPKGMFFYAALSLLFAFLSLRGLLLWNKAIRNKKAILVYS